MTTDSNVSVSAPSIAKNVKAAVKRAPAAPKSKPVLFTADKSKTMWIRMLVCREPGVSNDKLDVLLKAGGLVINPSTIATIANDVRATIKAAIDCGKWAE